MKKIKFMDCSFRDGFQSCLGARVKTEDFLPALDAAVKAGINYIEIDWEASEQNAKLAKQYGIIFAPTMVVVSEGQHQVFARPENIRKFIEA